MKDVCGRRAERMIKELTCLQSSSCRVDKKRAALIARKTN
jgi:hypothetical protein